MIDNKTAANIHQDAFLIDSQGVTVLLPVVQLPPEPIGGVDYIQRALDGGVSAQNVTLGIGGIGMGGDDFRALVSTMHGHYCYFEIEPRLIHVLQGDDIRQAKRDQKLGVIFGVQGIAPKIEDDPGLIRIVHKLGLRIAQLTYNERCSLGCGCLEQPDTGLTQLGRICIREMNHVGICVDLAPLSVLVSLLLSLTETRAHFATPLVITPTKRFANWGSVVG